ncbi:pyridoxamine 5'-phosphate oxidase family protein [Kribbella sp. NBC_01245]|uniref:pyridoxamine 5'-phosphate oxidase family protein n=1 Tax=Kribbella sp. NBC_01245 TaxID=2903578 RepID=UPI002E2DBDF6|nr:pyridoxamine 5'-phosphate oxidase family protein [Kribbella sp. NBC_01245]
MTEPADIAREVITTNRYMVLGTADADGNPWVTPVYFTADEFTDFYWVSSPTTLHSANVAVRPRISIAIFDSTVRIGGAQAVYMTASAALVPDDELEAAAAIYNSSLPTEKRIEPAELRAPGLFRLYRATASEHSILIRGGDPRYGRGADSRLRVTL